ncbi:MAG: protein kinase, partial [Acidobacteriota bacterium]|nr:protein kinase [Acidobacteriota bacterium]
RTGEALAGTPGYMSPEQLAGRELTAQSDIYSLGLVLYELFTGRRAFEASTLAEMLRLRRSDSTPTSPSEFVPDLDPLIERIIWRCLDRDPRKRPATALSVAAALPGGDPLAAALAAGETPTPEMVAAAPAEGALRPPVAAAVLAAALASLSLLVLLSGQVSALRQVPLTKSPEVLAERARSIVASLGYADAPADTAYGFGADEEFYRYVRQHDQSRSRWESLKTGQPALLYFWHRQGPRPLEPQGVPRVSETDPPPLNASGMADVRLDTLGRLIELEVSPPQVDASDNTGAQHDAGGSAGAQPAAGGNNAQTDNGGNNAQPDWAALFKEAGLDISKFKPTEPRWTPPTYADARAAWEGVFPLQPGTPLRVEAAGYRGRPVYFQLVAPWDKPYRMQPFETEPTKKRLLIFVFGLFLAVLLGAAWMARRNMRLGRGDRKGAFRLALFIFVANLTGELIGASHVSTFGGELWVLFLVVSKSLFFPAMMWLMYMALEPHLRRRAPHRIISWSRLLAGAYRDPLVGRDVLVGVLLGIWMKLSDWVAEVAGRMLNYPPDVSAAAFWSLLGVRGIAPNFLDLDIGMSFLHGLGFSFLLLLVSLALRGERRGVIAVWLMAVVFLTMQAFVPGNPAEIIVPVAVATATGYVFVAARFGLLSLTVAQFVFFMCLFYPYTSDFTVWYAGATVFALSVTTALAVYGFRTSLAGRPLLRDGALGD